MQLFECRIRWHEDGEEEQVTIAVTHGEEPDIDSIQDQGICYYVPTVEDLYALKEEGSADFLLLEVIDE